MIAMISAVITALEDEERSSRKCNNCLYCSDCYLENGVVINKCTLLLENELRKSKKGLKSNLGKCKIYNDCQAENCLFFVRKDNSN